MNRWIKLTIGGASGDQSFSSHVEMSNQVIEKSDPGQPFQTLEEEPVGKVKVEPVENDDGPTESDRAVRDEVEPGASVL